MNHDMEMFHIPYTLKLCGILEPQQLASSNTLESVAYPGFHFIFRVAHDMAASADWNTRSCPYNNMVNARLESIWIVVWQDFDIV